MRPNWIKISDRLPEPSPETILVGRSKSGGVPAAMAGMFDGYDFLCFGPGRTQKMKNPTHWAKFPKAPTG